MGIFPNQIKIAKVVPIFKSGDDTLFTNYRPITMLPSTSKVVQRVIFNQLYTYLMDFSMEVNIRKSHSTEFALLALVELLNMMDNWQVSLKSVQLMRSQNLDKKLEFIKIYIIRRWYHNYSIHKHTKKWKLQT